MNNNFVGPNKNFTIGDEDSSRLKIVKKTLDKKFDLYLSNSFGFGGTNSALIVKKYS